MLARTGRWKFIGKNTFHCGQQAEAKRIIARCMLVSHRLAVVMQRRHATAFSMKKRPVLPPAVSVKRTGSGD
jgi:hypothetical protein